MEAADPGTRCVQLRTSRARPISAHLVTLKLFASPPERAEYGRHRPTRALQFIGGEPSSSCGVYRPFFFFSFFPPAAAPSGVGFSTISANSNCPASPVFFSPLVLAV